MDKRVIVFSAVMAALMLASAAIVITHSDESDAATLNYDVGDTISNQGFGVGNTWTGSIPGISFEVRQYGGQLIVVGTGTFTTAGTYTIKTYIGSSLQDTTTVTVSSPTPTEYLVTFSSGTGGSVNVRNTTAYSGSTFSSSGNTLTISYGSQELITATATPASGYAFDYWSPSSGTITSNKTITAYFTALPPTTYTCYLYYNANGGSFAPTTQSYTGTSTSSHTFTISSQEPVRNNYTFLGWSTSSTATTASYQPGDSISVGYNSSRTLYAVWQAVPNYTVTLAADPTIGGTLSAQSVTVPSGTTPVLNQNTITIGSYTITATPAAGYGFVNWLNAGTITSDKTISAHFAHPNSYVVGTAVDERVGLANTWTGTVPGLSFTADGQVASGAYYIRATGTPTTAGYYTLTTVYQGGTTYINFDVQNPATAQYTVSISITPPNGGTVTRNSVTVDAGTAVSTSGNTLTIGSYTITASPASGYTFVEWQGVRSTVDSDFTINAYFIQPITIDIGVSPTACGTVTPSSVTVPNGITFYSSGATLTFSNGQTVSAAPNTGYAFAAWSPSQGTVSPSTSITAQFAEVVTIQIATDPSAGGTVAPSSVTVLSGTSFTSSGTTLTFSDGQTVDATPASNYTFHQWTPSSGTVAPGTQISASFTASPTFTVNFRAFPTDDHGTVSQASITVLSGTTYTVSGDTISFADGQEVTAIPASDGVFVGWSVSGEGTVISDRTISAEFAKALQDVIFNTYPENRGTFSPTGLTDIPYGTAWTVSGNTVTFATSPSVTVTFTPESGYVLDHWSSDSGTVHGYEQTVITAVVERNPTAILTITIAAMGGSGTVSPASFTVPSETHWYVQDNTIVFETSPEKVVTATPDTGFHFDYWSPTGSGNIYSDSTFRAYFTSNPPDEVRVTVSAGDHGWISSSSSLSVLVPYGTAFSSSGDVLTVGTHTYTAVPDEDYEFNGWNPSSGSAVSSSVTWITASFVRTTPVPEYTLTFNAAPNEGGTLSETTLQVPEGAYFGRTYNTLEIVEGDGVTGTVIARVYATPNAGYELGSWSNIDGTVTGPRAITAHFSTETIPVTISATAGGSVSQTTVRATYGSNVLVEGNTITFSNGATVIATPADGFRFDSWSNATGQIVAPKTITANFVGKQEIVFDFAIEPEGGGQTSSLDIVVPYYSSWASEDNMLIFTAGSRTYQVTATPSAGYTFHHWEPAAGRAIESGTIKAVFDKDFSVKVEYNRDAVIYVDGTPIARDTSFTVNQDNRHQVQCVPNQGYTFAYFYYEDSRGDEIQTDANPSQLPMATTTFKAMVVREGNVTVTFVSGGNGEVEPATLTVPAGSRFIKDGDSLVLFSDRSIRATAIPDEGYALRGWSSNVDQYIVSNTRITAYFEYDMGDTVWWANGYANNKATIVFDYPETTGNLSHYMAIPLLEYNRLSENAEPQYFRDTGYVLTIESGYNKRIHITLTKDGVQEYTASYVPGVWQRYALVLDAENGTLSYQGISSAARNPVREFNFMDYVPISTSVIADWSSECDNLAFARIYHKDVGNGTNHPNFQIGDTATFLNTYGVVMIDPVLNIYEQFPAYEDLRLNLYSFALYGDTITFNGYTFDMDGSYITVRYDRIGTTNVVSTTGSETFTAPLTNIYITWMGISDELPENRSCTLTFVERNQTFDLGTFAIGDLTISGEGMWYFTTALWEPFDTVKKTYVMDWSSPFNLDGNGFLLIFIALLVIVLVIMNIFWQPTVLDYAVVFGAGLISLITLGTF